MQTSWAPATTTGSCSRKLAPVVPRTAILRSSFTTANAAKVTRWGAPISITSTARYTRWSGPSTIRPSTSPVPTWDRFNFAPTMKSSSTPADACRRAAGGTTWKRYVDPIAPDSPQLYHGKIWIPGVTNGLENIQGYINRRLVVKPGAHDTSQMFLRLGYDDKPGHYDDNGYYDHDDGTDDQCKGIGAAFVIITIRSHSKVPAGASLPAAKILPMDMVFDEIDDNLVGVNPTMGSADPQSRFPAGK